VLGRRAPRQRTGSRSGGGAAWWTTVRWGSRGGAGPPLGGGIEAAWVLPSAKSSHWGGIEGGPSRRGGEGRCRDGAPLARRPKVEVRGQHDRASSARRPTCRPMQFEAATDAEEEARRGRRGGGGTRSKVEPSGRAMSSRRGGGASCERQVAVGGPASIRRSGKRSVGTTPRRVSRRRSAGLLHCVAARGRGGRGSRTATWPEEEDVGHRGSVPLRRRGGWPQRRGGAGPRADCGGGEAPEGRKASHARAQVMEGRTAGRLPRSYESTRYPLGAASWNREMM
jgi:hypothetical protein